jgi:8-oxo-dGTP diphosphatase
VATHSAGSSENGEHLTVATVVREISAGGVVLHEVAGAWHVALIEPEKEALAGKKNQGVLALPKGLVDSGEEPRKTAIREVFEETGVNAEIVKKLIDIKYTYVRTWSDGQRVFKIVTFYLMRYLSGEIDDLSPEMRIEVKRALWVPLATAVKQMAYSSEKKVVEQANEYVGTQSLQR